MTRIDDFEGSTEQYIQFLETLVLELRSELGHPVSVPTPTSLPLTNDSVHTSNTPTSQSVVNAGRRHHATVEDVTDEEGIGDWIYDSSRLTVLQTLLPMIFRFSHLFLLVNQGPAPSHSLLGQILLGLLMIRHLFKQVGNGRAMAQPRPRLRPGLRPGLHPGLHPGLRPAP